VGDGLVSNRFLGVRVGEVRGSLDSILELHSPSLCLLQYNRPYGKTRLS
jgi:hypothetical protein